MVVTNLDFEWELKSEPGQTRPTPVRHHLARWRYLMRCAPNAAPDAPAVDHTTPQTIDPDTTIHYWGLTDSIRALLPDDRLRALPDAEAIRRANDKCTGVRLRRTHGLEGLSGTQIAATLDDAHRAVAALGSAGGGWVLKHPMGVSGRGIMMGRGDVLDGNAQRWARAQFKRGWCLVIEPRVTDLEETSLHAHLCASGAVTWHGACSILTDKNGTYRGQIVRPRNSGTNVTETRRDRIERWTHALEPVLRDLATEVGYHGPVSIDGFTGRLHGTSIEQPLSEVNARYSFGRAALELRRWLSDPEAAMLWHHPPRTANLPAPAQALSTDLLIPEGGICVRLPEHLDPDHETGTLLVLAHDMATLRARFDAFTSPR